MDNYYYNFFVYYVLASYDVNFDINERHTFSFYCSFMWFISKNALKNKSQAKMTF